MGDKKLAQYQDCRREHDRLGHELVRLSSAATQARAKQQALRERMDELRAKMRPTQAALVDREDGANG